MRGGWKDILIQDLVDAGQAELKTGPFGTQLHASDYVEHGTPVINVSQHWIRRNPRTASLSLSTTRR